MKIVLDTNIVLISIPTVSPYRLIYDSLLERKYELIISQEILLEYEEIVLLRANRIIADNVIGMLLTLENVLKQDIYYRWNLIIADMDDNKFTDTYIVADADFLVTNDSHFRELRNISFPKINVIDIEAFADILKRL
ncbi:MAG: putative toxin-antitoxin system toxin component, PIN family [Chitinophagales bacterium]|nr:putative toxin-antitoxin system toxin component, PIN family [Chitinophagaceae bacterium]MBP9883174.1 putative toxin-antitoxin system toxin component, PIN family [Chitinophagales bacterium]